MSVSVSVSVNVIVIVILVFPPRTLSGAALDSNNECTPHPPSLSCPTLR